MTEFNSHGIEHGTASIPADELERQQKLMWGKSASEDLASLGIVWDDMRGKITLDVGAGPATIGESAKLREINVISLDNNPESWVEQDKITIPDVPYTKGDAEQLPFPDESFDKVISHAGPLTNTDTKTSLTKMIGEAYRVLKKGGELRFGNGNLNANIFEDNELFQPEEQDTLSTPELIQRVRKKSLEFLKSLYPNFEQIISEDDLKSETSFDDHPNVIGYYRLVKT